jgi:hypothetical protein
MNNQFLMITGIIVFVLFLLNAIFLTIIFLIRRRMATVSQWSSTMGTVVMSRVEQRSTSEGYSDYPVVHYSYQVSGQPYQGLKLAPGPEVGGSGAGKVVSKYPVGAQVMVFYNPQNPSEAVLERKAPGLWIMWLLLVVFDCVLCGVMPLLWWTMRQ